MSNENEWRQHLLSELKDIKSDIKEIRQEMGTLKVRVAGFSAFIGSIVTLIFKNYSQ